MIFLFSVIRNRKFSKRRKPYPVLRTGETLVSHSPYVVGSECFVAPVCPFLFYILFYFCLFIRAFICIGPGVCFSFRKRSLFALDEPSIFFTFGAAANSKTETILCFECWRKFTRANKKHTMGMFCKNGIITLLFSFFGINVFMSVISMNIRSGKSLRRNWYRPNFTNIFSSRDENLYLFYGIFDKNYIMLRGKN